MIPILYDNAETTFTSNGLGRLIDATSCQVTEERNGQYELIMQYPVGGQLYDQLIPGNYIAATHEDSDDIQPFEIYNVSAPLQGLITVNAWHISYKLNYIVCAPFTATTCANAVAGIATNSMNTNPFTFSTDKTMSASFSLKTPANARSVLGGMAGSILDIYGPGEFEFDKWAVKFHTNRGADNGVSIRYGKNIRSLDMQLDGSNKYNAVVPYWTNDETVVALDHVVTRTGQTADHVIALDMSSEFETAPTMAQLEAAAQTYIDASANYKIKDNLKIDIVPIWKAAEYQYNSNFDAIKLCDTVTIIYGKYNINATAKVIKVVYNTLLNRYDSIELGEPQTTLSQQIAADVSSDIMQQVPETAKRTIMGDLDAIKTGIGFAAAFKEVFLGQQTSSSSPKTFSVAGSTRALIVIFGAGSAYQGLYSITAASSGAISKVEILSAANVTVTVSTNTLTISDSSSTTIFVYALIFNGSIT